MEKRRLGNTDIYTSVLGFGASPLGGVFGEVTQAEADDCVRRAIDVRPFLGFQPAYHDTHPLSLSLTIHLTLAAC
jgi:L-galactose dehydrogenase